MLSLLVATYILSSSVLGQADTGSPAATVSPTCTNGTPGTLTVSGNGMATATADQAQVSLSVAILNSTADGARQVAALYADNVISAIEQIPGIYPENVTTTSVSVVPQTSYNSDDGTSTTTGYTYTNSLSIQIGTLTGDLLSKVLDTAVQNGGNNLTINSVSFDLSPALSYNKTVQARSQAVRNAKTTAGQYSQNFGVDLGPLLSIVDQSAGATPVQGDTGNFPSAMSTADNVLAVSSPDTPISIGEPEVDTTIEVVYTICTPLL